MATLKDLRELMIRVPGVSEATATLIITEMMARLPGEKVYIPTPDRSKREQIERAAQTLPTSVVAERFGVSQSYARRIVRRVVIKKRN